MTYTIIGGFLGLGFQEILILAVIALLLFGATRLPDLGRAMGKTVTGFKEGMRGEEESAEPTAKGTPTAKVEPEPLKAPQRLTAPTFTSENSQTPKA